MQFFIAYSPKPAIKPIYYETQNAFQACYTIICYC